MLIKVKVFADSKKEIILKTKEDEFQVWVKQKPLQGRANQEVIRVLADHFNVLESGVRLIRGQKTKNKLFEINDQVI